MSEFKKFCRLLGCGALILIAPSAAAMKGGITNTAGRCDGCHGGAVKDSVVVTIEGPSALQINQEAAYVVRIQGGPLMAAGFNLRLRPWGEASLIAGEGSRLEINELTHIAPRAPLDGAVVFPFRLKAGGKATTLTLLAAGNSVNVSNTAAGDWWNRSVLLVKVGEDQSEQDAGVASEQPHGAGCSATGSSAILLALLTPGLFLRRKRSRRVRCSERAA